VGLTLQMQRLSFRSAIIFRLNRGCGAGTISGDDQPLSCRRISAGASNPMTRLQIMTKPAAWEAIRKIGVNSRGWTLVTVSIAFVHRLFTSGATELD